MTQDDDDDDDDDDENVDDALSEDFKAEPEVLFTQG